MALADHLASAPKRAGHPPVMEGLLEVMPKADREAAMAMLGDPGWSDERVGAALRAEGYRTSNGAVRSYRLRHGLARFAPRSPGT